MKLLVTGVSGFVGQNLIERLDPKDRIVCLGRKKMSEDNIEFYQVDISDYAATKAVAKEIKGSFDAIVHLAAYVPKQASEDRLDASNAVNIGGTINLLEAFGKRANKIIIGSTAEVYDQDLIDGDLKEMSAVAPGSYYAATKLSSEFIAQTYGKKNNIPVTTLRFSVMYGSFDPIARALPNFIKAALADRELTVMGPGVKRDYIHTHDVVSSILQSLKQDAPGVFNIGTGVGTTIGEAAKAVVQAAKSQSHIKTVPGSGVDIVIDTSKAATQLGFHADYIFPQGIEEMIHAYRER